MIELLLTVLSAATFAPAVLSLAWWRCCCTPPPEKCGMCEDDTTPTSWDVDFSGIANDIFCTECGDLNNTTWNLVRGTGNDCFWILDDTEVCTSGSGWSIELYLDRTSDTVNYYYRLSIYRGGSPPFAHFESATFVPETDCSSAKAVSLTSQNGNNICDLSSATATIAPVGPYSEDS